MHRINRQGRSWTSLPRLLNSGASEFNASSYSVADDKQGNWVVGFKGGYASYSTDNGVSWASLTQGLNSGNSSGDIYTMYYSNGRFIAGLYGGYASRTS